MSVEQIQYYLGACGFKNLAQAKTQITKLVQKYPSLIVKAPKSTKEKDFVIEGTVPFTFQNAQYQLPISIKFYQTFPKQAPEMFIVLSKNLFWNPNNKDINENGKIIHKALTTWTENSQVDVVLQQVLDSFSYITPIYSDDSKQKSAFNSGLEGLMKNLDTIIAQLKHSNPTRVKKDVTDLAYAVGNVLSVQPRIFKYKMDTINLTPELCLQVLVKVRINGADFFLPTDFWLPKEYPAVPPHVYCIAQQGMMLVPNEYVDNYGRVSVPYMKNWNKNESSLGMLYVQLQQIFAAKTPLYSQPKPPVHPPFMHPMNFSGFPPAGMPPGGMQNSMFSQSYMNPFANSSFGKPVSPVFSPQHQQQQQQQQQSNFYGAGSQFVPQVIPGQGIGIPKPGNPVAGIPTMVNLNPGAPNPIPAQSNYNQFGPFAHQNQNQNLSSKINELQEKRYKFVQEFEKEKQMLQNKVNSEEKNENKKPIEEMLKKKENEYFEKMKHLGEAEKDLKEVQELENALNNLKMEKDEKIEKIEKIPENPEKFDDISQKIKEREEILKKLKEQEEELNRSLREKAQKYEEMQKKISSNEENVSAENPGQAAASPSSEDLLCQICMERNKCFVVLPCAHTFCEICGKDFISKKCPICDAQVESGKRIYL